MVLQCFRTYTTLISSLWWWWWWWRDTGRRTCRPKLQDTFRAADNGAEWRKIIHIALNPRDKQTTHNIYVAGHFGNESGSRYAGTTDTFVHLLPLFTQSSRPRTHRKEPTRRPDASAKCRQTDVRREWIVQHIRWHGKWSIKPLCLKWYKRGESGLGDPDWRNRITRPSVRPSVVISARLGYLYASHNRYTYSLVTQSSSWRPSLTLVGLAVQHPENQSSRQEWVAVVDLARPSWTTLRRRRLGRIGLPKSCGNGLAQR